MWVIHTLNILLFTGSTDNKTQQHLSLFLLSESLGGTLLTVNFQPFISASAFRLYWTYMIGVISWCQSHTWLPTHKTHFSDAAGCTLSAPRLFFFSVRAVAPSEAVHWLGAQERLHWHPTHQTCLEGISSLSPRASPFADKKQISLSLGNRGKKTVRKIGNVLPEIGSVGIIWLKQSYYFMLAPVS